MKCKDCKYYKFHKPIYFYQNSQSGVCLGKCLLADDKHGNMTFAINPACDDFEPYELHHGVWDSFLNKSGVITIERIERDYYPRVYRVFTSRHGGFSISEEELEEQGYKKIYTEPEIDDMDKEKGGAE